MSLPVGFSAFAIFLAIAAVGFLFLIVSFVFGEIFGHADLGGHGGDVHGDIHGVSFFNTRVLSVFVTAFGGFGAIGVHLGYRIEISTAIGSGGRSRYSAESFTCLLAFSMASRPRAAFACGELVGRTAQMSVAIPARADWARFAVHWVKT